MQFFVAQFTQLLSFLSTTIGSLGWAIVAFTFLVRLALYPLTSSSLRAQKKIRDLQPELKKLGTKHKGDKQALQRAQMELYQKYNVNPLAGCLPQLVQIFLLIVLYQALLAFLNGGMENGANLEFFWLNLGQPDPTYALPVLAAVTQLILSLMIAPGAEIPDVVPNKSSNKKVKKTNEKEEDMAEMAASMQQQMLFIMPIMTGVIALRFPSGLALYWVVATVFSIAQQYFISGWGGLTTYYQRFVRKYAKN